MMWAQPRIDYRLRAVVKVRSGGGDSRTVRREREIVVMPCLEPSPPVDVADFPGDFVGSISNTFRSSRFSTAYLMTVSMTEPSSVLMTTGNWPHSTTLYLEVEIQTAAGKASGTNLPDLLAHLKDLRFKIQPVLRAKTYYSTDPFAMMPGQAMIAPSSPVRLHDTVLKLSKVQLQSTSWQPRLYEDVPSYKEAVRTRSLSLVPSQASSEQCSVLSYSQSASGSVSVRAWSTVLSVPVQLTGTMPPSFCSAIASRQYSIIARVSVFGARVDEFVLEVPLQMHNVPCVAAPSTSRDIEPSLSGQMQDSVSEDMVRMPFPGEHEHRSLANISRQADEELPEYS